MMASFISYNIKDVMLIQGDMSFLELIGGMPNLAIVFWSRNSGLACFSIPYPQEIRL